MARSESQNHTAPSKVLNFLRHIFNTHPEWVVFVVVFGIALWLNLNRSDFNFYWDAGEYWNKGKMAFINLIDGTFSVLNFQDKLRGYLLPLIFYAIIKVAAFLGIRDIIFLEIVQAFVFSGIITIIVPNVTKLLFNNAPNFWQILTFSLLVLFFWQGYFFYPLSDFWAFSFFIFGAYLFLRYHRRGWGLFFAGIAWGGALFVRPSYSISLIFLPLWALYYLLIYQNQTKMQTILKVVTIMLGLTLISLPQLLINVINHGTFSPLPLVRSDDGNNLYINQLSWGIRLQRYETFVGLGSIYPVNGVAYLDRHGSNLLTRSGYKINDNPLNSDFRLTIREYIVLVLKHPLDFLVIYSRHLFNGLDVAYTTPYVYDVFENTSHVRFINYSLWFLTILYISRHIKASSVLRYQFLLLLILTLPSIFSIPTAIEIRFMIPVYFIAYAITAFFVLPAYFSFSRKKQISVVLEYSLYYFIFMLACFLISANAFTGLKYGMYIFW